MECKQKQNIDRCNCTYAGCPRHGICCDCIAYHRRSNELPACYFSKDEEKSYDRSIAYFVKNRS